MCQFGTFIFNPLKGIFMTAITQLDLLPTTPTTAASGEVSVFSNGSTSTGTMGLTFVDDTGKKKILSLISPSTGQQMAIKLDDGTNQLILNNVGAVATTGPIVKSYVQLSDGVGKQTASSFFGAEINPPGSPLSPHGYAHINLGDDLSGGRCDNYDNASKL